MDILNKYITNIDKYQKNSLCSFYRLNNVPNAHNFYLIATIRNHTHTSIGRFRCCHCAQWYHYRVFIKLTIVHSPLKIVWGKSFGDCYLTGLPLGSSHRKENNGHFHHSLLIVIMIRCIRKFHSHLLWLSLSNRNCRFYACTNLFKW